MGEVYLAQDIKPGRNVTLKILPTDATSDHQRVRRFTREAKAASALNHPNILTIYQLGSAYAAKGMYAEATAAYQEAIKLGEDTPRTQMLLGAAFAKAGERAKAQAILKRLQSGSDYVSPAGLAVLQAALGEREQAFASLEKACTSHDLQLQYLSVDPALDSLRSDPHFAELVRRVGLPD